MPPSRVAVPGAPRPRRNAAVPVAPRPSSRVAVLGAPRPRRNAAVPVAPRPPSRVADLGAPRPRRNAAVPVAPPPPSRVADLGAPRPRRNAAVPVAPPPPSRVADLGAPRPRRNAAVPVAPPPPSRVADLGAPRPRRNAAVPVAPPPPPRVAVPGAPRPRCNAAIPVAPRPRAFAAASVPCRPSAYPALPVCARGAVPASSRSGAFAGSSAPLPLPVSPAAPPATPVPFPRAHVLPVPLPLPVLPLPPPGSASLSSEGPSSEFASGWPRPVSVSTQNTCKQMFKRALAKNVRSSCCVCGVWSSCRKTSRSVLNLPDSWRLLKTDERVPGVDYLSDRYPAFDAFRLCAIYPWGVTEIAGVPFLQACSTCWGSLDRGVLPSKSMRNGLMFGAVPTELQGLTVLEELVIARVRVVARIVKLATYSIQGADSEQVSVSALGLSGNVISFPQDAGAFASVAETLPVSASALTDHLQVVLSSHASMNAFDIRRLLSRCKILRVRRQRVCSALKWLILNNPLYAGCSVDAAALSSLPEDGLPVELLDCVSLLPPAAIAPTQQSRGFSRVAGSEPSASEEPVITESGMCDFDGLTVSPEELLAASVSHLQAELDGVSTDLVLYPSGNTPCSEYDNAALLPSMFPTLFPYGRGGFEDPARQPLSMTQQVRHMVSLRDRRFRTHSSFAFIVSNILTRRSATEQSRFSVSSRSAHRVQACLSEITAQELRDALPDIRARRHRLLPPKLLALMREVKWLGSRVPGSIQQRSRCRQQIQSLIVCHGIPSLFLTLSPYDLRAPLVSYFAGLDVDIASLSHALTKAEQQLAALADPFACAEAFHATVEAFFSGLFGWDFRNRSPKANGVFGEGKAFFGTVECQGRGTLHIHVLLWLADALPPDVIRSRLSDPSFASRFLSYLDSIISLSLPEDGRGPDFPGDDLCPLTLQSFGKSERHVCSFPPPSPSFPDDNDLVRLVCACQVHICRPVRCKVPCKSGFPHDMSDQSHVSSGVVILRRNSPHVNSYNDVVLSCCRCNMDVQFLGSKNVTNDVIYYVTDYITKTPLDTFACVELYAAAFKDVEDHPDRLPEGLSPEQRSSRMVLKCFNKLASRVETSMQAIASRLLGFPEHYSSHTFSPLYWQSIVEYVRANIAASASDDVPDSETVDPVVSDGSVRFNNVRTDYMFRPHVFRNMCLYDFVRTTSLRKMVPDLPEDCKFLVGHSLIASHRRVLNASSSWVVPNLNVLALPSEPSPGSDEDDLESFAAVYLSLFMPWRRPCDLLNGQSTLWTSWFSFKALHPSGIPNSAYSGDIYGNICAWMSAKEDRDRDLLARHLPQVSALGPSESDLAEGFASDNTPDACETLLASVSDDDEFRAVSSVLPAESPAVLPPNLVPLGDAVTQAYDSSVPSTVPSTFRPLEYTPSLSSQVASWLHLMKAGEQSVTAHARDGSLSPQDWLSRRSTCSLNLRQKTAFYLAANHAYYPNHGIPLRAVIHGEAGTGKSTVISCIRKYFEYLGLASRIKLAATTGSAASQISGASTIHSLFSFSQNRLGCYNRATSALRLGSIDYLIVDEVSMLDCVLLNAMDKSLRSAKGVDLPFGGVVMLFFGDFRQHKPVGGYSLITNCVSGNHDATKGRALWLQCTHSVELDVKLRTDDPILARISENCWNGTPSEEDFAALRSRSLLTPGVSPPPGTLLVTPRHGTRIAYNRFTCRRIAEALDVPIFVVPSVDKTSRRASPLPHIKETLRLLRDDKSGNLMGELPLFVGQRVTLSQNLAPSIRLVNGSLGTVLHIELHPDDRAPGSFQYCRLSRAPRVVYVHFDNCTKSFMDLPPGVIPMFAASYSVEAKDLLCRGKKTSLKFTRFQLPLLPAYAVTDYRAQGATLPRAIIDIGVPSSGSLSKTSIYVMLTRCRRLADLYILGGINYESMKAPPAPALCSELARMRGLPSSI